MIPALLRGKLSGEQENMEDLLTSAVFGQLSYVPPAIGLIRLLERAEYPDGRNLVELFAEGASAVEYEFWPWLDWARIEPDLQIRVLQPGRTLFISIEAKFHSGKSGQASDNISLLGDQLARQWEVLLAQAKAKNAAPIMIYLTADYCLPRDELQQSALEYVRKRAETAALMPFCCAWLSWRQIPQLFASSDNSILADLARMVKKLGLSFYSGITNAEVIVGGEWQFNLEARALVDNKPTRDFNYRFNDEPIFWRFGK